MAEDYIHGFSEQEQQRLARQAQVLAPNVFSGWDLSGYEHVLELGCGVGAELELMRERWPDTRFTGVDISPSHLDCAREVLSDQIRQGSISLVHADARDLPFDDGAVDCVVTIWMLEHASAPKQVLAEAHRVLRYGGKMIATEVDNDTFHFEPGVPAIANWWTIFNRFQAARGGHPTIGRHLGDMVQAAGFQQVTSERFPNVSSRHEPDRKEQLLDYLEELLLSGSDQLFDRGDIQVTTKQQLVDAFAAVRDCDDREFQYLAYRVEGTK